MTYQKDAFIIRKKNRYIGKVVRSEKNNLPRKLLGAWIYCPRKLSIPKTPAIMSSF